MGFQAVTELGLEPVILNLAYQTALKIGWYRMGKPQIIKDRQGLDFHSPLTLPDPNHFNNKHWFDSQLMSSARRILNGQVLIFGNQWVDLDFSRDLPMRHWSLSCPALEDIKFIWEPARFDWVYPLARAWWRTKDDRYVQAFWNYFEDFLAGNPAFLGPQWASGQEVALRLLAMCFAGQVFRNAPSSSPDRLSQLAETAALCARRIPPTLIYARSQQNNHLISEALGLYTAGVCLPNFPEAPKWKLIGWDWLNKAFQDQIAEDGTYAQHSTNYHRLMLTLALWADAYARATQEIWPDKTRQRLAAATIWLAAQMDPSNGRVPNLGSNDGAWLSPLAAGEFQDYRPVVQAASLAFLGKPCLPSGAWDEFSIWLGLPSQLTLTDAEQPASPAVHRLNSQNSTLLLRAVQFTSRPSHADQLHVDLWWRGENIALDAGTYQYNAAPPWDNGLASTTVHNTLMIDQRDQMRRAGRFLWLDWAQAKILSVSPDQISAEHYGYRRLGLTHRRTVLLVGKDHWQITDEVIPQQPSAEIHSYQVHWLLPAWEYRLNLNSLSLTCPLGTVNLEITSSKSGKILPINLSIIQAGQTLHGTYSNSLLGWYSPTYGQRSPALSVVADVSCLPPLSIQTDWLLSNTPSTPSIE